MKVKSSKVLYFEKCPLFSKTTVKRNIITQFFSMLCKCTDRYSNYEKYSCFVLLQKILALKFRQCCMFPWFYFGTVYQTKSRSLNNIMASAAQTDSFALIKKDRYFKCSPKRNKGDKQNYKNYNKCTIYC